MKLLSNCNKTVRFVENMESITRKLKNESLEVTMGQKFNVISYEKVFVVAPMLNFGNMC